MSLGYRWAVGGLVVLALALTSCASAGTSVASEPGGARREPKELSRRSGARRVGGELPDASHPARSVVGGAVTIEAAVGITLHVTLLQVIDPAQVGNVLAVPQVGMRFVGVDLSVSSLQRPVRTDLRSDTVLLGTDGVSYQHDDDPITGCTGLPMGTVTISPGSPLTGCVTFEVPVAVSVSTVELSLAQSGVTAPAGDAPAGTTALWKVG